MMRGGNFGEATGFARRVSFKETLQYETVTINENRAGGQIHRKDICSFNPYIILYSLADIIFIVFIMTIPNANGWQVRYFVDGVFEDHAVLFTDMCQEWIRWDSWSARLFFSSVFVQLFSLLINYWIPDQFLLSDTSGYLGWWRALWSIRSAFSWSQHPSKLQQLK